VSSFADIAANTIKRESLKSLVSKWVVTREEEEREAGFHVSELHYLCPRFEVLSEAVGGIRRIERTPANEITFDIGHALHRWWQEKYLGPMGLLVGDWVCSRCGHVVHMAKMPVYIHCKDSEWLYSEIRVENKEHEIVGRMDGILDFDGEYEVMDIKTRSASRYKAIKDIWPADRFQIIVYMWLSGIRKGRVVYLNKDGGEDFVKDMVVEYDEAVVSEAKSKTKCVQIARKSGTLPEMCLCRRFGKSCADLLKDERVVRVMKERGWK